MPNRGGRPRRQEAGILCPRCARQTTVRNGKRNLCQLWWCKYGCNLKFIEGTRRQDSSRSAAHGLFVRRDKNPQVTLRAIARRLQVGPSTVFRWWQEWQIYRGLTSRPGEILSLWDIDNPQNARGAEYGEIIEGFRAWGRTSQRLTKLVQQKYRLLELLSRSVPIRFRPGRAYKPSVRAFFRNYYLASGYETDKCTGDL